MGGITCAATTTGGSRIGRNIVATAGERGLGTGKLFVDGCLGFGQVAFADGHAVEGVDLVAFRIRSRLGTEIILHVDPCIARLVAERATRIVTAMDHAVLATRIARYTVHHTVFLPIHRAEHLLVAGIVAICHEIAGGLPALHVVSRDRPRRAGQLALAREEFLINRCAEDGEHLAPLLNVLELLACQFSGEEEFFWIETTTRNHVFLGGIVIVTRRDRVTIHVQVGEILEHIFQFLDVRLFVNRRVRGDLITEHLGHLDGGDAFLEDTFTFHDEIVGVFQTVHMHIPIHPLGRLDDHLALGGSVGFADLLGFLFGHEFVLHQLLQLRLHLGGEVGSHVFAHLFAHEHTVGADVNDTTLLAQTGDEFFDLRVDEGFATADGHHRGITLRGGRKALLQRHHVLETGGIFADAAAASAGQIAGVQRFQLQHHGKFWRTCDFMLDDMTGNLDRQGQRETHRLILGIGQEHRLEFVVSRYFCRKGFRQRRRFLRGNRIVQETRQEERGGGNGFGSRETTAAGDRQGQHCEAQPKPKMPFFPHWRSIGYARGGATTNYKALTVNCFHRDMRCKSVIRQVYAWLLWLSLAMALGTRGENTTNVFQVRAEKAYAEAKQAYEMPGDKEEPYWEFGRACFDLAEFARNDDEREKLALEGIKACRALIAKSPKSAPGHYYLAMNSGQLARTKTLGALPLVREMETLFHKTADLDNQFDYAGATRNLGILYFEAPGWPTSIGSRSKAKQYLAKAVELSPGYPDNHLYLMEAYLHWHDEKALLKAVSAYQQMLSQAKKDFTGEKWEESWLSWDKRWKNIQLHLKK